MFQHSQEKKFIFFLKQEIVIVILDSEKANCLPEKCEDSIWNSLIHAGSILILPHSFNEILQLLS